MIFRLLNYFYSKLHGKLLGIFFVATLLYPFSIKAQELFEGDYKLIEILKNDKSYDLYVFELEAENCNDIKLAYFVNDAYRSFQQLKESKEVLLATSASFTSAVMVEGKPIGFCAENGMIINKMPNRDMDGVVIVNTTAPLKEDLIVLDLQDTKSCQMYHCESHYRHFNPRELPADTYDFFNWIEKNRLSAFQTQLVYSSFEDNRRLFKPPFNGGNDRTRRFLVLAEREGRKCHLIVDAPQNEYLMKAAGEVLNVLEDENYRVEYMLNLDTGSKDILHAFKNGELNNLKPNPLIEAGSIENANNLLVYYFDN